VIAEFGAAAVGPQEGILGARDYLDLLDLPHDFGEPRDRAPVLNFDGGVRKGLSAFRHGRHRVVRHSREVVLLDPVLRRKSDHGLTAFHRAVRAERDTNPGLSGIDEFHADGASVARVGGRAIRYVDSVPEQEVDRQPHTAKLFGATLGIGCSNDIFSLHEIGRLVGFRRGRGPLRGLRAERRNGRLAAAPDALVEHTDARQDRQRPGRRRRAAVVVTAVRRREGPLDGRAMSELRVDGTGIPPALSLLARGAPPPIRRQDGGGGVVVEAEAEAVATAVAGRVEVFDVAQHAEARFEMPSVPVQETTVLDCIQLDVIQQKVSLRVE